MIGPWGEEYLADAIPLGDIVALGHSDVGISPEEIMRRLIADQYRSAF